MISEVDLQIVLNNLVIARPETQLPNLSSLDNRLAAFYRRTDTWNENNACYRTDLVPYIDGHRVPLRYYIILYGLRGCPPELSNGFSLDT